MQLIPRALDANYVPLKNIKTKQNPEKYNLKGKIKSGKIYWFYLKE